MADHKARRRPFGHRSRRLLRIEPLESRLLLAGDTFLINFQLAGAPVPTGYAADTGELYGDRGGGLFYGWSSDHTDVSRDRGFEADQRLDTLIHFHENQIWELELPDGLYEVTVSIGDAEFSSDHTLNVEGVNYWSALALTPGVFQQQTQQITVADGRLTLDQGAAVEKATRIDFVHVVGLPNGPNTAPATPKVIEPVIDGQVVNPTDVHMEATGYFDADSDAHKSSDWEIWTVGVGAEPVWQTLGIEGVERLHTHLGDGVFINSHAGRTDLEANTDYELRVRFRDEAGSVSGFATRTFQTADASTIFPLELQDVRDVPSPEWLDAADDDVVFPPSLPEPSELRLESADGDLLLSLAGGGLSPIVTNPPALADHADLRIVMLAGSEGLLLGQTRLIFQDDHGQEHTVYLPAMNLAGDERLDLWVASEGSTYYGTAAQTEPDFSNLAQKAELSVPYLAMEPGFVVEEVAGGFQLPTNIAFVPEPGLNPGDPLFYVTELYGTIKVVTNDFTVSTYATDLLNYDPTGAFPGSGEQGLTGIVANIEDVDPSAGVDLRVVIYATRVWDTDPGNGSAEPHHPQVIRFVSTPDGLSAAGPPTVLLNMVGETQGQSHQISNASIGPDGKLYIHMGDGFDYTTAQNLDSYRGKILRMNLDGTAPTDNPFYNAGDGINARDYVYAYGLRNPFGGAWRESDGKHYEVENGPSVDRFAQINVGQNYNWNNTDASMFTEAIYNWNPAHAPVNITFVQPGTFDGSQFPAELMDRAYVSESGPTYAEGPQALGKRIVEFELDGNGDLVSGPNTFVDYVGVGRASVVGLTAGPDGLYFTELYKDLDASTPIEAGARVMRVRYVNPLDGDYDIDGDVDEDDYSVWRRNFGSTYLLAADGNGNGVVDAADYAVWRDALNSSLGQGGGAATIAAVTQYADDPAEDAHPLVGEEIVADVVLDVVRVKPAADTSGNHTEFRPRATFERVTTRVSNSHRDDLLTAWLAGSANKRDRRGVPHERPSGESDTGRSGDSTHCGIDAVFDLWGADGRSGAALTSVRRGLL